jgi:hypothetical protein
VREAQLASRISPTIYILPQSATALLLVATSALFPLDQPDPPIHGASRLIDSNPLLGKAPEVVDDGLVSAGHWLAIKI